ncbi:potassium channel [Rhizodiscina lignyota]|uniref:Potassium channel n=1 Tax=Rhizodiscina lignyota TaxID=1504668 RepID=A0A9P4MAT4_9PEZI|nr:potassium channel [Rhizodiscina lignyota]
MNDPGLDSPVNEAAKDLEHNPYQHLQEEEEAEEENFLDPRYGLIIDRWWFASTACPLIAGTFGPMANSFSICALVQSWRVYVPKGVSETKGQHIKDPPWLIAVNSVSLALALIANLALLLNMARRIPFAVAQSITIVGFFLASFMLIALVSVASSHHLFRVEPSETHALSQAYYYGIIAAALYFIISCLMIGTVWGAWKGHYRKEFRLTISQRTLMIQTIMFMLYLLLGACIYSFIEGWEYLDAVYWADFTLLTIGIGDDFTPATHLGRGLLFPYAVGGIVTIGLVVGSIRTLVLERAKAKMEARMTEKRRERVLSTVNMENETIKVGHFRRMSFSQTGLSEPERREQEFNIMRKIQSDSSSRRRWMSLLTSTLAACGLWFIGALIFMYSERAQGWSYFVSLYFSYTTLLTIGYGDAQPASNSGRPFFVFWSLLAIPTLTILISNMGDTVVKLISDVTIWAASITILPGEHGIRAGIKTTAKNAKARLFHTEDFRVDRPPGFLFYSSQEDDKEGRKRRNRIQTSALDRMTQHLEEEELHETEEAEEAGDPTEADTHFYHYLLARELRNLMRDVNKSPPKQYSYAEWAYFLMLIGQDEDDPDFHRRPPGTPPASDEDLPGVCAAKWSWLGPRSPLMASKTESEWILERVSVVLETELKSLRGGAKGRPPPISMKQLKEYMAEKEKATGEAEKKEQ